MRALGLSFFVLALTSLALADYRIPRVEPLPVDATVEKWTSGNKGFRIDVMASAGNSAAGSTDACPTARVAWTEKGLQVLVIVHDTTPNESDSLDTLWVADSVEIMVSDPQQPGQMLQFIFAPGRPAGQIRTKILQRPVPNLAKPPTVEVARKLTQDGYTLEALIPWSDLGLSSAPAAGAHIGMQLIVNDGTTDGKRLSWRWRMREDAYQNPASHQPLVLATDASDPITTLAGGEYQAFRRYRVRINTADTTTKQASISDAQGKVLGTFYLANARGKLDLPYPDQAYGPLNVVISDKVVAQVEPTTPPSRKEAMQDLPLRGAFVFEGPAFPALDLEHPAADDVLGDYQVTTRYFDSNLNEVKTAEKPGRYAAVVHIESEAPFGLACDRIATLYRPEGKIDWWMGEWPGASSFTLPKEFGIPQDVVTHQNRELMQLIRGAWSEQSRRDDWVAMVLAGMKETTADAPAYVWRTGPEARNDAFHQALRQKLGMLKHYQYVTYLPAGYQADKDKKFPLLVYLHGSGTRGDDLKEVERSGLPRYWKEHPEFPAIVIAPQCPKGEWWTPLVINNLIDEVMAKYRVDSSRVYMTGLSMGGFGTWNYAVCFPERLAAIVPICGIGDDRDMARLKSVPTWVFHGDADGVVPIEPDRKCVEALKAAGGDVTFTIYPGVGHDAWSAAYATPELYKWMASKSRK